MSTNYIEKVLNTQKSGLVGYWPLNEESGTTAYDLSGNGYNATSKGLLRGWNDRRMLAPDGGKCAQFDGTNSAIDFNASSSTDATAEGSLSIWVATPENILSGTTAAYIVKFAADANNLMDLTFDTTAYRFTADNTGQSTSVTSTGLVYNENANAISPQWHHFVVTWSETNDALNFYVDSIAQTAGSSLGGWSGSMDTDLMCLGSSAYATPANQFTGWMAHFAMWTPILTQAEVDDLYFIGP
jgi:hypothetical protein